MMGSTGYGRKQGGGLRAQIVVRIFPALVAAFWLVACVSDGVAGRDDPNPVVAPPQRMVVPAAESSSGIGYTVTYREGDCPFLFDEAPSRAVAASIRCGYMQVPQDRHEPQGLTIEIAVAIIESVVDEPLPDPIVYLEGGPGGGAVYDAEWWLDSPLREQHRLILVDQRGTGFSWPNLGCPELYDEAWDDVSFEDSLVACRDRLVGLGVDLGQYHSGTNAQDLADLRRVLKIDEWNLVGVSYGTRLALTVLRDASEGIRSVVLDSVYPPDVYAYIELPLTYGGAIHALLDGCAEDRRCARAFPDLRQTFYDLLLDLAEEPLYFSAEETGGDADVELDGYGLVGLITDSLYDTELIPLLPMLIDDMAAGDYDLLLDEFLYYDEEWWSGRQRPEDHPPVDEISMVDADGMFYSSECYEESSFATLAEAAQRADVVDPLLLELLLEDVAQFFVACEIWLGENVAVEKAEPVYSDVPVLLLAGEYDPATPPSWARLAAQTLSNHTYVELPRGGHGLIFSDDCMMDIALEFLLEPENEPDTACVDAAVREWILR